MKTWSLSHQNKHFKNHLQKAWLEIGRGALWCSGGCFCNSVAALHSLFDSGRMSSQENRGIRLLLVVGFGHALCLDFLIWFSWLNFCLNWFVLRLGFWFCLWFGFLAVFFGFWVFLKIRDGAKSYTGKGTEASPGHTCSSCRDILWGWFIPLGATGDYPGGTVLLIHKDCLLSGSWQYLRLSQFLNHKVDFFPIPKRAPGSLFPPYPVCEKKQEYKLHTINRPEKYHNHF